MRIIVDADACPTKQIIETICLEDEIELYFVCDTSHQISSDVAKVIVVDKSNDSADYKIISILKDNDIVVTNDYGLANMCLLKRNYVITFSGLIIDKTNIDGLLHTRYLNQKARLAKVKTKNIKKRTNEDDLTFKTNLKKLISTIKSSN